MVGAALHTADAPSRKTGVPKQLRRRVFWTALLLIPPLFLLLVETGLRAAGYARGYPLFVPLDEHPDFRMANPEVGRRYFSASSPPTVLADFFRSHVPDGTLQIVVQGGSTAAGFPYYYGGTFPHILEARLKATLPGRSVQVLNTAMAAVNSFTLYDLSKDIIELKPDAVLIYAGHNEYYGALGVGSTERLPGSAGAIRGYLLLQRLRLVQLLKEGLDAIGNANAPTPGRMEELAMKKSIPFGSRDYESGIAQFRSNMEGLLERYAAHDIPVLLATVVSNTRDQPPFVSGRQPEVDTTLWRELSTSAQDAVAESNLGEAYRTYQRIIEIDTLSAVAQFEYARLLEGTGRHTEARAAYVRAKELDELRFRAPEGINMVIRELARRPGAHLVDVQSTFREASRHGAVGRQLMVDHLHPTPEGYFLMADAFYEVLYRELLKANRQYASDAEYVDRATARSHVLLTEVDSLVGAHHIEQLMSQWPFTMVEMVSRSEERVDGAGAPAPAREVPTVVTEIAERVFERRMSWSEANARLIAYYERTGALDMALHAARCRLQELPHLFEPHVTAARLYAKTGRFLEAAGTLESALVVEERPEGHLMLADVYRRIGRTADALRHARIAASMHRSASN